MHLGMKSRTLCAGLFLWALGWSSASLAETLPAKSLALLADRVASKDQAASNAAILSLRQQGYAGIQAFLNTYKDDLKSERSQPKLKAALDSICQQKDCDASGLYWYTDLKLAEAAARASGKPILSLRLLGNLNEELSCANSRFFRTVLYPNAEVSQLLRDRFILHWQSVRPVPKVTIDFGDGRKLERTLTGNSIHYILDSNGRPVDALPGLYSPRAFYRQLLVSEKAVKQATSLASPPKVVEFWRQYHRDRLAEIQTNWDKDLSRLGQSSQPLPGIVASTSLSQRETSLSQREVSLSQQAPNAETAGRIAIGKAVVEMPILRRTAVLPTNQIATKMDDPIWARLTPLYTNDARLDANSQMVIRRKLSPGQSYKAVLQRFENAIAQDSIRNEYLLYPQIQQWFIGWSNASDLQALNERVYAELFLTPNSDPWLGLLPQDTYTGIAP
jgi:hypothetical protein